MRGVFQAGPAVIIERRRPFVYSVVKPKRPGVGKAKSGIAADVLIVSLRDDFCAQHGLPYR